MRQYEKSLRLGLTVVLCALILRLCSEGLIPKTAALLSAPNIRDFLIYLETGRVVRSSSLPSEELVYAPESPPPWIPETVPPEPAEPERPVFTQADTALLRLYNTSGLQADPEELLLKELPIRKSGTVLLYSTHTTESYTPGTESYVQTAMYRTLDEGFNMLSLGEALAQELEERGVPVLRDQAVHDYPSYNGAYSHARKAVQTYLTESPGISLVLDLHRDAADTASGQLRTLAHVEGRSAAQIMLVVGTDARGLTHPNWRENLALALQLQVLLERLSPGITRPVCLRPQRFNQDLSPGCLLIEIGGAGNTRQEALAALPVLAQAIGELLQ